LKHYKLIALTAEWRCLTLYSYRRESLNCQSKTREEL